MAHEKPAIRTTFHEFPSPRRVEQLVRKGIAADHAVKIVCSWAPDKKEEVTYDLSTEFAKKNEASIIVVARTARKIIIIRERPLKP